MISVIVCSINPARFAAVEAMYRAAIGAEPWEMIGIHDAKSLAEGYNRAFARARGETIVFSHDDVELLSPAFPQRLAAHLANYDLIGVAGTSRLANARWVMAGPPFLFGQVCHVQPDGRLAVDIFGAPRRIVGGMQALDGLFLAARRSTIEKFRFDETTFDHFHLYDLDFTYQCYLSKLRLAVANDINFLHLSAGKYDETWLVYAKRFELKWRAYLEPIAYCQNQWTATIVHSRQHAAEVMSPAFWEDDKVTR